MAKKTVEQRLAEVLELLVLFVEEVDASDKRHEDCEASYCHVQEARKLLKREVTTP